MGGMSAMQCVTIGLGWGHTDGPVHFTLPSRAADRVGAERMHALSIMKASVCCKRAVEDTVTDPQTDHFKIISLPWTSGAHTTSGGTRQCSHEYLAWL